VAKSPVMILTADSLGAPHGFFTRLGGVSAGAYASLNCGFSTGDDHEAVSENRARALGVVGGGTLVGLMQVHGIEVVEVTEPWQPGSGPRADAMVTRRSGVALGIVTADCAPILLADVHAGVVGAAHAGWRGAVAGVIEATAAAMIALGARPGSIAAGIGPCIGQSSYEVGLDVYEAVVSHDTDHADFLAAGRREGRWQFDLAGYCAARLAGIGLRNAVTIAADTAADESRFFSHRRRTLGGGGPIGHQISIITLNLE
jgi:YfiH family protein